MKITTMESVPGQEIETHIGLVSGSTVRAKHLLRDVSAFIRNLLGGEIKAYTELLDESRTEALSRMIKQAKELGANAIVNVRFSTSSVAQGAAELYVYGTAVKIRVAADKVSGTPQEEKKPVEKEPSVIIMPAPEEEL